jgi:uncharacterized protein with HEPN domain
VPPRNWRLRISDILECIEATTSYIAGLDYGAFAPDSRTTKAVIHDLFVIDEAAINVPDWIVEKYPVIPWRDMRDMRNVVMHEYFGTDPAIVWDTARNDLPTLVPPVRRLLQTETAA